MSDEPRSVGSWQDYALHMRKVLSDIGVEMDPCGPGEPQDCGQPFAAHALSYAAALVAKAERGLWHMHHGDPAAQEFAEEMLEHWRAEFARTDRVPDHNP